MNDLPDLAAPFLTLAHTVAHHFALLPQVAAVALSGSQTSGVADALSDIDLYVYTRSDVSLAERQAIIAATGGASHANVGMTFWGTGDEWTHAASGIGVDIMFFDAEWMQAQITRVVHEHGSNLGYTTCFWRTVRQSQCLYDRDTWFATLQAQSHTPYPEPLRQNIIAHNHPVLRTVISSYLHQIEKAVQREDLVSVNHRVAALLASYFDVVFAFNRVLHPGEKRLLKYALNECPHLPTTMSADVLAVLSSAATADQHIVTQINTLLDRLDDLLQEHGFDLSMRQQAK